VRAGWRAVSGLARLARDADVIHANDIRAALYCQAAAIVARRPWIFHARDLYTGDSSFERMLRRLRPTRVVAMSHAIAARATEVLGWPADGIDVVHSGIDADAFGAGADGKRWRDEVGLGADDIAIGTVGRLVRLKGFDDVIRAAAIVAPSHPGARFFIVGGELTDGATRWGLGDLAAELTDLAASLGVGDRVVLTGPYGDIASVMAGLDIAVMASWWEGFGLVVLEAMSQGVAVVVVDVGGPPEIVVHGESGIVVPQRSPRDLAAALQELLENPERRRALAAAGRSRVEASFQLEAEASGIADSWSRASRG
jgi:glycosyltransferase involved in cell wall biosynthesis